MDLLKRTNDTLDKLGSIASSNKERISKGIISAILMFIIFAVFGCFDFVTLTFNIQAITTVQYWASVTSKTIAGVCAFNIGINLAWDNELDKNNRLKELKAEYDRLIKFMDEKTFNHFVTHIFNPNEKKKAWIGKINRKIYLLNKFAKHKDLILYTEEGREEEKAQNKYCIKRAELEKLKTDEYISKNIGGLPVKYRVVDPVVFRLEIDARPAGAGVRVQGNTGAARTKMTGSVVLGMVTISMFMTSLAVEANGQQFADQVIAFWHYFLKCCEDVGVVLWQIFRGLLSTRKIIDSEYLQTYAGRIRVLTEYINYCNENNVEESKAYRLMHLLEEERKTAESA